MHVTFDASLLLKGSGLLKFLMVITLPFILYISLFLRKMCQAANIVVLWQTFELKRRLAAVSSARSTKPRTYWRDS